MLATQNSKERLRDSSLGDKECNQLINFHFSAGMKTTPKLIFSLGDQIYFTSEFNPAEILLATKHFHVTIQFSIDSLCVVSAVLLEK